MLLNVINNHPLVWYGKCKMQWSNGKGSLTWCSSKLCHHHFVFAIYVDDMIVNLQNNRLGCTVGGI